MKKLTAAVLTLGALSALADVKITNGTEWVAFRFDNEIKEGSLVDFSNILPADRPAGARHGRLIADKNGHLIGEKSGERVRLVGANLNFDVNFMDKETVDRLAAQFRRMGYNSVRLHHTDVLLMSGGWNGCWSSAVDAKMLDRLDYTFAAFKREGMYVTTDFYQMRRVNNKEMPGLKLKKPLGFGQFKSYLALFDEAFDVWTRFPEKLMNHVNPYTGLTWKDDPALAFVVGDNEDTLMSICGHVPANGQIKEKRSSPMFEEQFALWKEKNALEFELNGCSPSNELWYDFLIEKGSGIQRKYVDYLNNKLGYKGFVSGVNWWDLKFSVYEREELTMVDNHGYADHPQSGDGYTQWNQTSNLKGHPCYAIPMIKAPTRIPGRPMAITEWQFCMPNQFRAESGTVMGAYSAFQDWDATYRFAWSHNTKNVKSQMPMSGSSWFDIASDPLNQVSDKINVLLFRRQDVQPAKELHCYAVTRSDAIGVMGDMWKAGMFPARFTALGYRHAIGSQLVDAKHPLRRKYDKVYAAGKKNPIAKNLMNGNVWTPLTSAPEVQWGGADVVSDTGELVWSKAGRMTVATPRTESIVAYPKGEKGPEGTVAGGLSVKPVTRYQVVTATSLDGSELRQSRKVLLFHLTNMYNNQFAFDQPNMRCVANWGRLPYLIACGSAEVSFKSDVAGLELVALRYDGTPIRREKATYADGAYSFTLSISPANEAVVYYALVPAGSLEIDTAVPPPIEGLDEPSAPEKVTVDPSAELGPISAVTPAFGAKVAAELGSRMTAVKAVSGIPGVLAVAAKDDAGAVLILVNENKEPTETELALNPAWSVKGIRDLSDDEAVDLPPNGLVLPPGVILALDLIEGATSSGASPSAPSR